MRRRSISLLLILVALTLTACDRRGAVAGGNGDPEKLILTGSSTIGPLAREIARRFEKENPGLRIDVQTGGSSRGIADATRGTADIGMSSRRLKDNERPGLATHVLANDGVCFLVHESNPVTELSRASLVAILQGRIDDWSEVGGVAGPITMINRAAGRSEIELVTAFFDIEPSSIEADVIAGENQQCIKLLASDPSAILFMSVGTAVYESRRGTPIRLLPLEGVEASMNTVASAAYPLSRPLILVTPAESTPLVRSFLDFALSPHVHDLIEGQSFVPVLE